MGVPDTSDATSSRDYVQGVTRRVMSESHCDNHVHALAASCGDRELTLVHGKAASVLEDRIYVI